MHIYDLVEVYSKLIKGKASNSLEVIDMAEKQGIKKMVDCLIEQGFSKKDIELLAKNKPKGRKAEVVNNPIAKQFHDAVSSGGDCDFLGDAVYGMCQSFENEKGAKRVRITPRKLTMVMRMPEITTEAVKGVLFVGDMQARRYIKAAKTLITILNR